MIATNARVSELHLVGSRVETGDHPLLVRGANPRSGVLHLALAFCYPTDAAVAPEYGSLTLCGNPLGTRWHGVHRDGRFKCECATCFALVPTLLEMFGFDPEETRSEGSDIFATIPVETS